MIVDLMDKRFGRLTVIGLLRKRRNKKCYWLCSCDCGTSAVAGGAELRIGHTKSCGCFRREVTKEKRFKHGFSNQRGDAINRKEYDAWKSMIERCTLPNNKSFKNYGGRGITVCREWRKSFTAFLSDIGNAPDPAYTLERINNDGNYEPSNVKWATRKEQAANKRPRSCPKCRALFMMLMGVLDIYNQHVDVLG